MLAEPVAALVDVVQPAAPEPLARLERVGGAGLVLAVLAGAAAARGAARWVLVAVAAAARRSPGDRPAGPIGAGAAVAAVAVLSATLAIRSASRTSTRMTAHAPSGTTILSAGASAPGRAP